MVWKDLRELLDKMMEDGAIKTSDKNLVLFTDSVEEAALHIRKYSIEAFGLKRLQQYGILGEKPLVTAKP